MPTIDEVADADFGAYVIITSGTGQRRTALKSEVKYLEYGETAIEVGGKPWKPTATAAFKTLLENGYPDATKMPADEFARMKKLYDERERLRKGPDYYVVKVAEFHEGLPVRPEDVTLVWHH